MWLDLEHIIMHCRQTWYSDSLDRVYESKRGV